MKKLLNTYILLMVILYSCVFTEIVRATVLPLSDSSWKNNSNEQFKLMEERWTKRLIGTLDKEKDEDILKYIDQISKKGKELWKSLDTDEKRTYLWQKLDSDSISSDYTTQFNNIKNLALSVYVKGSALYGRPDIKKELVNCLNFMIDIKKYNGDYWVGNWWDWQIGSSQPFIDVLFLLKNDKYISCKELIKLVTPITKYAHDPNIQWPNTVAEGANLTDIGLTVLGTGILMKDYKKITLVKDSMPKVINYVSSGNGLYPDGSIIQHNYFGYNGSYGNVLIQGVGQIQSILYQTDWSIDESNLTSLYNVIEKGYLELMIDGKMPSFVNGRSISRLPGTTKFSTEFYSGRTAISNLLIISKFSPPKLTNRIQQAIKKWIEETKKEFDYYSSSRDFESILLLKKIMKDDTIIGKENSGMVNVYGAMDKVFQKNKKYSIGISMYSKRIANFESINKENKKGWHTSDGMVYIYNKDYGQFDEGYWPTIDPYRLPGITVNTSEMNDSEFTTMRSSRPWAGGSTDGTEASVGMYLDKSNERNDLEAKKSWFLLSDGLVALGTNIKGHSNASIETILENRMVDSDSKILLNGNIIKFDNSLELKNINGWMNIHGKFKDENVAYIVPRKESVTITGETRTGAYSDINGTVDVNDKKYTRNYFKVIKNHGNKVSQGEYEYVVLPNKTDSEVLKIYNNPIYKLIRNDNAIQAISTDDKVFINVWKANEKIMGVEFLSGSISAIIEEKMNGITKITFSHPAQISKSVGIKIKNGIKKIISKDNNLVVIDNNIYIKDGIKSKGKSYSIEFEKSV